MSTYLRAIYRIEARADGPSRARQIVERELSGALDEPTLEEVKLLVSELVTNGIRHGGPSAENLITLELALNGKLRCSVSDRGPGFIAGARRRTTGGWGLALVEQLATRWGVTRSPEGTHVWFESGRHADLPASA